MELGNQQVKEVSETDLAYLAGSLDGEGCFTIARKSDKRQGGFSYSPAIYFTNTNAEYVARVCEIYDSIGVSGHIMTRKQPERTGNREYYVITVGRLADIKRVVDILIPWLTAKHGQAQLLKRFVDSRIAKGKGRYFTYTSDELSLVTQIRQLNNPNGNKLRYPSESSEAIRRTA